mgnify:FL=1
MIVAQVLRLKSLKSIWFTILAVAVDVVVTAVIILSIYYCNYMVPYKFDTPNFSLNSLYSLENGQGLLPHLENKPFSDNHLTGNSSSDTKIGTNTPGNSDTFGTDAGLEGKFADKFSDQVVSTDNSYQSQDLSITITPYRTGSGDNAVTYYVADVYTSNINCFRTYFAQNTYGSGYTEHLTDMSNDVRAILAMNGDSYCYNHQHTAGALIRNGRVYRAEPTTSDVCILYRNGEMNTYSPDQFNLQQAVQDGAYQSWTFGPSLLDEQGKALTNFNTWDYIRKAHPRSAIGYYEPGHYCFVVVDGRQTGYSRGMTLSELAQVFQNLGCSAAYNLDGGHSTFMTMNGQVVNHPYKSNRQIVDCLYFGEVQ